MTFRHDHKNYFQRLPSMGHENIASFPMVQESFGFIFRIKGFRKKESIWTSCVFVTEHLLMKLLVTLSFTNSLN